MLGCHQVNVVAAAVLQLQHHRGQLPRGHRLTVRLPGDAGVLAEHAPQVAAGEEDRARTVPAAQAVLLTEMREMRSGRDHGISPAIADRRLDDVITVLADEAPGPHQALALREQMSVRSLPGLSSLSVRRRGGA